MIQSFGRFDKPEDCFFVRRYVILNKYEMHSQEDILLQLQFDSFHRAEVLQYLGWRGSEIPPEVQRQIDQCITETFAAVQPRYTYQIFGVERCENSIRLMGTDVVLPGQDVWQLLADCKSCVLMAATLGAGLETCIRRAQVRDMTRALILDCCGSAAIEAVCDRAEQEIQNALGDAAQYLTDRFSPGYGDMPIDFQRELTALLDTGRQIGLTLTDSCILTPRKSVTAIIGLADRPQTKRFRGCAYCSMFENCTFRKAGKTCGK